MEKKIWAHSGDSHFLEPERPVPADPPARAGRAHASLGEGRDGDGRRYTSTATCLRRPLPKPIKDGEFAGETIETLSVRGRPAP